MENGKPSVIFRKENLNSSVSSAPVIDSNSFHANLMERTFDFLHYNHILAEYLYGHELVVLGRKCNKKLSEKYPFDIHTKYFYHTCILSTEHLIHIAQRGLSRFSCLERLELEKHEDAIPFTLNGFYELGHALTKCSSHLMYLNLSGLSMRSTGLLCVFRGFIEEPTIYFYDQTHGGHDTLSIDKYCSESVEAKDLNMNGINDYGASSINDRSSDIRNPAVSPYQDHKHYCFIKSSMVASKVSEEKRQSGRQTKNSLKMLYHLDLAYNDIGDGKSGLSTLANLLPLCPSLKYLDLGHNFITCLSNESLKTIVYKCKTLEVFDLRGNLLSENGSRTLFLLENIMEDEIKDNPHIPFLASSNLSFTNTVKNSTPSTSSIKRIDLTSNQIKDDNFIPFCEQILHTSKFSNLKYIKASKNYINLDQTINPYYEILKEKITFLT